MYTEMRCHSPRVTDPIPIRSKPFAEFVIIQRCKICQLCVITENTIVSATDLSHNVKEEILSFSSSCFCKHEHFLS